MLYLLSCKLRYHFILIYGRGILARLQLRLICRIDLQLLKGGWQHVNDFYCRSCSLSYSAYLLYKVAVELTLSQAGKVVLITLTILLTVEAWTQVPRLALSLLDMKASGGSHHGPVQQRV